MSITNITDQLIRDEGVRLKPYQDTVGKTTIGVGRNLTDVGISASETLLLLQNDIKIVTIRLGVHLPWWVDLDPVRQGVLINMAFNMGIGGLLTFKLMLAAIRTGRWETAAMHLLNSKYARQVGRRAVRLADQLRTGVWQ